MDGTASAPPRELLLDIAQIGINAVRPEQSIAAVIGAADPFWQTCAKQGYVVLAFGKASVQMTRSVIGHLGKPVAGVIVTHQSDGQPVAGCEVITASHPIPDSRSIAAGVAISALATAAPVQLPVVVLVSGGASALVEIPRPGVQLDELQIITTALLRSGLPISPMNIIRQGLSDFKGGGLARLLAGRASRTLVISDVVGNDASIIASGPMSRARWQMGDPWELCPESVRDHITPTVQTVLRQAQPLDSPESDVDIIADAKRAAEAALAAARGQGIAALLLTSRLEGDAADRAHWMLHRSVPGITICAGETTVVVEGSGLGGRNQHAALAWALENDDPTMTFTGVAVGTDGRDGPTDAAGAIVDSGTTQRIRSRGGDPVELFRDNNSHHALALAGDLVPSAPTGTNVGDLWLVLR